MVASPEKLHERMSFLFHYHKQQISYKVYRNLFLDGICTFSIEVFQGEVLLYLLEGQFYLPAFTGNFIVAFYLISMSSATPVKQLLCHFCNIDNKIIWYMIIGFLSFSPSQIRKLLYSFSQKILG